LATTCVMASRGCSVTGFDWRIPDMMMLVVPGKLVSDAQQTAAFAGDRVFGDVEEEVAATVDQLILSSRVSFEMLVRRIKFIEEAYVFSPPAPVYKVAELCLGTGRKKGCFLISPLLAKHVADRVIGVTAVNKERRAAREERVLNPKDQANAKAGAGRGDSKGGDAGDG